MMNNIINYDMLNELKLYAVNDRTLYEQARYICKNLARKQVKGIYNNEKAIKAFYTLTNTVTKKYHKDFYSENHLEWYQLANTATRRQLAVELLDYYSEDIQEIADDLKKWFYILTLSISHAWLVGKNKDIKP